MDLAAELKTRATFLSTAEVMALLGKTRNTICEWARRGKIPAVRVANAYIFDPRLIADWLCQRQTGMNSSAQGKLQCICGAKQITVSAPPSKPTVAMLGRVSIRAPSVAA